MMTSTTSTRTRRERPRSYRLTDAAASRIHDIMDEFRRPLSSACAVGVKNGGCAGMSYTMDYAEAQSPLDEVVEDKGVRILIDPKAVMFLVGTGNGLQARQARRALHIQQSEPDGSLRLRRDPSSSCRRRKEESEN